MEKESKQDKNPSAKARKLKQKSENILIMR